MLLDDDQYCFACGMNNPDGLRIEWKIEGTSTSAEFIPDRKYQGWKGILHGGIIATVLDEAMTRLACVVCGGALTAEMTVRYVIPARIGEPLFIKGEIVKESRKIVEMRASLCDKSGKIVAHATGKSMKLK
ncbi:MAG: PaaI family thioesterase [Simkania sp.]|nr:PaaI family thioesterase [Simkania sp.]